MTRRASGALLSLEAIAEHRIILEACGHASHHAVPRCCTAHQHAAFGIDGAGVWGIAEGIQQATPCGVRDYAFVFASEGQPQVGRLEQRRHSGGSKAFHIVLHIRPEMAVQMRKTTFGDEP